MGTVQDEGARRLLRIIREAYLERRELTYATAAEALGRDRNHARAVAQMCDLLDAAAAYSRTPLLALIAVRNSASRINPHAWADEPDLKERIIATSMGKKFNDGDFRAIAAGLEALKGRGNHAAWRRVYEVIPREEVLRIIGGNDNAIPEISPNDPDAEAVEGDKRLVQHLRRERKPWLAKKKRDACRQPSGGLVCEACGTDSAVRYPAIAQDIWEVHHRLPLSEADVPVTNSLADLAILCPNCHRAIHRTRPMMSVDEFKATTHF
mgnify:CR=1 FL=1